MRGFFCSGLLCGVLLASKLLDLLLCFMKMLISDSINKNHTKLISKNELALLAGIHFSLDLPYESFDFK